MTVFNSTIQHLPVEKILRNPEQPRKEFDKGELQSLAESIKSHGLIQPIAVEGPVNGNYFLIDGERRLRAHKLAGIKEIRCEVRTPEGQDSEKRLFQAMIANLQRSDLTPTEEARAYEKLRGMDYSNNQIALELGICAARVATRLKLLELEPEIQKLIDEKKLSKDDSLVEALLQIKDNSIRVKTAKSLADRKATAKQGVEACKRIVEHINSEKISADEVPGIKITFSKVNRPFSRPVYDAQSALGRVPPWPLVEICTRETCDACGLRDVASKTTCSGCTMVEMLQRMINGCIK